MLLLRPRNIQNMLLSGFKGFPMFLFSVSFVYPLLLRMFSLALSCLAAMLRVTCCPERTGPQSVKHCKQFSSYCNEYVEAVKFC